MLSAGWFFGQEDQERRKVEKAEKDLFIVKPVPFLSFPRTHLCPV